jgi:hypothetical protein
MIEAQLELIIQAIAYAGRGRLIEVTEQAQRAYNHEIRGALQETVWAGDCQSWYKRPDGEIASLYPYNARTYLRDHRALVLSDFKLQLVSQA